MFFFGIVSGIMTYVFIKKYSGFMLNLFGLNEKLEDSDDEIIYGRHPMSDSDSEYEDSEYEDSDSDSFFEYEKEKETPCYMKDFYEETTLSDEWLKKSDTEKKKTLDRDIDNYMNQDQIKIVQEHLKNIKC